MREFALNWYLLSTLFFASCIDNPRLVFDTTTDSAPNAPIPVTVVPYGPPGPDGVSHLFDNCTGIHICLRLSGEEDFSQCEDRTWEKKLLVEGVNIELPPNKDLCIGLQASHSDPAGLSHGQTCAVVAPVPGSEFPVYMMPGHTVGPTVDSTLKEPTAVTRPRVHSTVVELPDGKILIAGGRNATEDSELYVPSTGTFEALEWWNEQMHEVRVNAAAVALPDGRIAIFGGFVGDEASEPTASVEIFTPDGTAFVEGIAMNHTRARHTATLVSEQGHVLLVGGEGDGSDTWEVWHPDSATSYSGMLETPRSNHTATFIPEELGPGGAVVLVAGGETPKTIYPEKPAVLETLLVFDLDAWDFSDSYCLCGSCTNDLKKRRKTLHAAAFLPIEHSAWVVLTGGFTDPEHMEPSAETCIWDSKIGTWASQGPHKEAQLSIARGELTATPIELPGLSAIVVAGGRGPSHMAPVEEVGRAVDVLFVDKTMDGGSLHYYLNSLQPLSLSHPRYGHRAIATCDGRVLFVGGAWLIEGEEIPVLPAELYNADPPVWGLVPM